jgi:hypothetical protein
MCVCPHTAIDASMPVNIVRMRSPGDSFVKISVSFRGVAWQNSTSPSPSIDARIVNGHVETAAT